MKMYNVEIIVDDELLARVEKLATVKGTAVEEEIQYAVITGLNHHMEANVSAFERWYNL